MSSTRTTAITVLLAIGLALLVLITLGLVTGAMNLNSTDGVLTLAGPLLGLAAVVPLILSSGRSDGSSGTCSPKGCFFRAWRRKPAPAPIDKA